MTHTLKADSIILAFGTKRVLSDIYIKCETGKITGLLGRNGQGKSSLMNIVYGTLTTESKSIRFDDKPVFSAYKRPDLLRYLPQFNFMPGGLTLKRIFSDFNLGYSPFERYFPAFKSKYKTRLKNLSGGQRRLVEVYVILKAKSRFAMLDEPFSHIMPLQVEKIKVILEEVKHKKSILITDHLYKHVVGICDSHYVLKDGKTFLAQDIEAIEKLGLCEPGKKLKTGKLRAAFRSW